VARWNALCAAEKDEDFGRPPKTMMPILRPPFYAMESWPIVSNTQGGPAHDPEQRVLDAMGLPIPRLYAAGEITSIFGHLYLEAGNITECFVGGKIAGRNAAEEKAWG
jgi:predicted oxidoreductase